MPGKALIELHFMPCLQWMSKFLMYDQIILEAHEHYQKGSYRNRAFIAGPNGRQLLSVPLKAGKNRQMPVNNVLIAYDEPWQGKLWRSILTAYGSAPYFSHYAATIKDLCFQKEGSLFWYSMHFLDFFLDVLDLGNDSYAFSAIFRFETDERVHDIRNMIHPKKRIADPTWKELSYAQVFLDRRSFLENLSFVDLLFCKGPESRIYLEHCILASGTGISHDSDH